MNRVLSHCINALLLLLLLAPASMQAQEIILSEQDWGDSPVKFDYPRISSNKTGQEVDTLTLPFFDDFSGESAFPNTGKWFVDNNDRLPFITLTKAIQPPTKGALNFDGVGGLQQIYDCDDRASGFADSIVSLPIDLTGLNPNSDVYLSFQYQPGGLVENPENSDSLLVYFQAFDSAGVDTVDVIFYDTLYLVADTISTYHIKYDLNSGPPPVGDTIFTTLYIPEDTVITSRTEQCYNEVYYTHWEKKWVVAGTVSDTSTFHNVILKLDSSDYFFDAFKFKIAAFGNLNGQFDNWFVDYVYMDVARSASDTIFQDASILFQTETLLMNGYTAIPFEHLQNHAQHTGHMGSAQFSVRNMGTSNDARTVTMEVTDPIGNNYSGLTDTKNITIPAGGAFTVTSSPFSDQTFSQMGEYRLQASLNPNDSQGDNDTIVYHYPVDSILAYDDGEAEVGYGLGSTRGYAMRFVLDEPDTMTAAWIQFVPAVHYNSTTTDITCLDGYGFRLNIWDHNPVTDLPDTLLEQQLANMTVDYGSNPREFARYALNDTLIVSDTFYVGISQVDDKPLGVGLDKSFDNTARFFFQNALGQWVNTGSGGTLMIRPEFGKFVDPFAVALEEKREPAPGKLHIIPNPSAGNSVRVDVADIGRMQRGELTILDLQGRILFQTNLAGNELPYEIQFPTPLPAGMYLLKVNGQDLSGTQVREVGRMVIH